MLEERIHAGDSHGPNQVRREIIKALTLGAEANLETHKAILEISKDKVRILAKAGTQYRERFSPMARN